MDYNKIRGKKDSALNNTQSPDTKPEGLKSGSVEEANNITPDTIDFSNRDSFKIMGVDDKPKTMPETGVSEDFGLNKVQGELSFGNRENPFEKDLETYNKAFENYSRKFKVGYDVEGTFTSDIRKRALDVSPYYRKYAGSDYITFDNKDWNLIAAKYNAAADAYGRDEADKYLQSLIVDEVASNQGFGEKAWNTITGIAADVVGSTISTVGMIAGALNIADAEYNENLSGFENFLNRVVDNDWTRYGNDVIKYGSIFNLERARAWGLSESEIINDSQQAQQVLSWNTPFEVLQQGGFTVAAMLTGQAYAKGANLLFKGLKKGAIRTVKDAAKAKRVVRALRTAENFNNRVIIPGLVGSSEGVIEGLETKQNLQKEGYDDVYNRYSQTVNKSFDELMKKEGYTQDIFGWKKGETRIPNETVEQWYSQYWEQEQSKLQDMLDEVDAEATKAGVRNFIANSFINGILNATLKAGLQAPSVRNSIRNSRLGKKLGAKYTATGTVGNMNVTPKQPALGGTWFMVKEPFGEFTEEFTQNLTNDLTTGMGKYNIDYYIKQKYNSNNEIAIGDNFEGSLGAGMTALGESALSKETWKAGIYGALSSIVGTMGGVSRTTKLDENGNVVYKKGSNGEILLDKKNRPIVEKTFREKGMNAKGERETGWERFQRVMPWRSGLMANYRDYKARMNDATESAKELEKWLNDPKNYEKFQGLVGTMAWAEDMNKSAEVGDEFAFRNSVLGKTVNDIFMLEKLKGTEFYNSIMQQLVEVANMERGSDVAQQYIKAIRENVETNDSKSSDDQIFDDLKKNARRMLTTIEKVNTESDKLEKLLGDMNEDTKQSLVYGQLAYEDWNPRGQKIDDELGEIKISSSVENSGLSNKEKMDVLLASMKGKKGAAYDKINKSITELETSIDDLSHKKRNKQEDDLLKQKKQDLSNLKELREKIIEQLDRIEKADGKILSEEEIMALPAEERAALVLAAKKGMYVELYGDDEAKKRYEEEKKQTPLVSVSEEQQRVIDNLVNQGIQQDKDFLAKIVDRGKIEASKKSFLQQMTDLMTNQESFSEYTAAAKRHTADAMAEEVGNELNNIEDYDKFVEAFETAIDTHNKREAEIIYKTLKNKSNKNFERWTESQEDSARMLKAARDLMSYGVLDDNRMRLVQELEAYLEKNHIDSKDLDAVLSALQETNDRGINKFMAYLEDEMADVDPVNRVKYTSIEEIYEDFKSARRTANTQKEIQDRKSEEKPINPSQTQPNPPASPVTTQAPALTEETKPVEEVKPETEQPVQTSENKEETKAGRGGTEQQNNSAQNSIDGEQEFDDNAAALIEVATRTVEQEGKKYPNQDAVKRALEIIEETKAQETIDDFENVLRQRIAEEKNELVQGLLRKSLFEMVSAKANRRRVNINAAEMHSLNITSMREKYGKSPIIDFYERNHIEAFLSDNKMNENTKVYFITDDALTEDVKNVLGYRYTEDSLPLIAAVRDDNGPYEVNGVKYQPIGIMPRTNNSDFSGSARLAAIRKLAPAEGNGRTVIQYNGQPLWTTTSGKAGGVIAQPSERTTEDHSVLDVMENDMTSTEKEELVGKTKAEKRNTSGYKRMRDNILKHLGISLDKNNNKQLAYIQSNMKDSGKNTLLMFEKEYSETTARDSDMTLEQAATEALSGNYTSITNFNSRTKSVAKIINDMLAKMPSTKEGTTSTINDIVGLANGDDGLNRKIGRFIAFRNAGGYQYAIVPLSGKENIVNGERKFAIVLKSDDESKPTITLAEFTKDSNPQVVAGELLGHLFMDGGQLRTVDGRTLTKWQIDYDQIDVMNSGNEHAGEARKTLENYIDDGLLKMRNTSFNYRIGSVRINSPFNAEGNVVFKNTENTDNSNDSGTVSGETKTQNGTVVDSDSGAPIKGNPEKPKSNIGSNLKQKEKEITDEAKHYELTADGKWYRDKRTGRLYSRVTTLIQADENGPESMAENNLYVLPSTNIGTTVDEFIRDFFAGTLKIRKQSKKWDRTSDNNYEVSSQGDKRFSALNATFKSGTIIDGVDVSGRTIEDVYQHVIKKSGKNQAPSKDSKLYNPELKTKAEKEDFSYREGYLPLWQEWAKQNPELIDELRKLSKGKILTDQFAKTRVSQARALAEIISEEEYDYPNATSKQWEDLRKQLEVWRNKMAMDGYIVVPRDVMAVGNVEITGKDGKKYNMPVAGTLDLLVYNTKGEYYVVDIKTVHSAGRIKSNTTKWSLQTTVYQKLLQKQFGINVVGRIILPVKVDYPAPSRVKYEQGEGTQLIADGKPYENAAPSLGQNVKVPEASLSIQYDKLSDENKALAEAIKTEAEQGNTQSGEEVTDISTATVSDTEEYTDSDIGLNTGGNVLAQLLGEKMPNSEKTTPKTDYFSELSPAVQERLSKAGLTKEAFNSMSLEERQHALDCTGK